MSQLIAGDVTFYYGATMILDHVSLTLAPGTKMGLVGLNGSGKSTLLMLLAGVHHPASGSVSLTRGSRVALLEQEVIWPAHTPLIEVVCSMRGELSTLEAEMKSLEGRLSKESTPDLIAAYGELQARFEALGGYEARHMAERYLTGLGIDPSLWSRPAGELSGGQQRRVALAQTLMQEADILLLDEPTNYLDIWARTFLEEELLKRDGAFMLVSHDRYFLDRVATSMAELEGGRLFLYKGNYSAMVPQQEERREKALELHRKVAEEKERLRVYVQKNIAGTRHKQAMSRRRRLEKLKAQELPDLTPKARTMRLNLPHSKREGRVVLDVAHMDVVRGGKRLISDINLKLERGERLAILGPNGCGKTSLLLAFLGELEPASGTITWGHNVQPAYLAQESEPELLGKDPFEAIEALMPAWKAGEIRSYLARFLFRGDHVFQHIDSLSGGEKSRLALAGLLLSPANVLILDEPTNHLDVESSEALEAALAQYPGTLIMVTHDRRMITRAAGEALVIREGRAELVRPPFERVWEPAGPKKESSRTEGTRERDDGEKRRRRKRIRPVYAIEREIDSLEGKLEELRMKQADPEIASQWEYLLQVHREEQTLQTRIDDLITEWEYSSERER